jgi:hypothetical protein
MATSFAHNVHTFHAGDAETQMVMLNIGTTTKFQLMNGYVAIVGTQIGAKHVIVKKERTI